jgi:hypothetical protein
MWCLAAAILFLVQPARSGVLNLNGETITGPYIPGYVNETPENDHAHSNDFLSISRNIFAPDSTHVVAFAGETSFGHLAAASAVATNAVVGYDFFSSSMIAGFTDTVTINGASSGFLSLDFTFHGAVHKQSVNGSTATGNLLVQTHNSAGDVTYSSGGIALDWFDTDPPAFAFQAGGTISSLHTATSLAPVNGSFEGQAIGQVLIPFSIASFDLSVGLTTVAFCHAPCTTSSDFSNTALIGGYHILDNSLNPIPGATLTSESGYDYVTPPGSAVAAAPEPGLTLLTAAVAFALARHSRHAGLRARKKEQR